MDWRIHIPRHFYFPSASADAYSYPDNQQSSGDPVSSLEKWREVSLMTVKVLSKLASAKFSEELLLARYPSYCGETLGGSENLQAGDEEGSGKVVRECRTRRW